MCTKIDRYSNLRGKIRAKYKTQACFAEALGLSLSSLSQKLNGRVEFTCSEMAKACGLLGIPLAEASAYFFDDFAEISQ